MDGSGVEGRHNFYLWPSFLLVAVHRSLSVYVIQRSNSSPTPTHALYPLSSASFFSGRDGLPLQYQLEQKDYLIYILGCENT
jgi:hypothetical protein